ncbi:hypothetical protein VTN00DRAFT_9762 [Thermoascus crustaceus]|uniref:uncharacterized protein n=1 Tax=Thermoascus crustaceus TaxID=5088 RepID=UPI00374422CC
MAAQIPQEPKTTEELESSIRDLSISSKKPEQDDIRRPEATNKPKKTTTTTKNKKKKPAVADSWEDEASESPDSSGSDTEREAQQGYGDETPISPASTNAEGPLAPPPTPISPQTLASSTSQPWLAYNNSSPSASRTSSNSRSPAGGAPARRPEKQTAVAGRMIAGALGIRAPKRTEEQRAYDRAMKEQEIKRRNRAREEEARAREEEERAKAAIWDG